MAKSEIKIEIVGLKRIISQLEQISIAVNTAIKNIERLDNVVEPAGLNDEESTAIGEKNG